jgi:hypothetical protein
VDIEAMKSGRIAIELSTGISKDKPLTKGESQVACHLKTLIAVMVADLAGKIPGSSLAVGEEDVETMRGMENLDLKKEKDDG